MRAFYSFLTLGLIFTACLKKSDITDGKKARTVDQVISFTVDDTTGLVADGTKKIKLQAIITNPNDVSDPYKKVVFETTAGTVDGTTTAKKEVAVNADGYAIAYVTVGNTAGTFYVSATTGSSSVYRIEHKVYARPIADSSSFDISLLDTSGIRADGSHIFRITGQATKSTDKSVKFIVTEGTIQGSANAKERTMQLDASGKAEIFVKTDVNVTSYLVSAETKSTNTVQKSFNVRRAYAHSMLIEPAALKIDTVSQSIEIKVLLFRNPGKVSTETPVIFESYQIDNSNNEKSAGRFTGLAGSYSNSSGVASVNFIADTGHLFADRPIIIRVKTLKDDGSYITKTIQISIK